MMALAERVLQPLDELRRLFLRAALRVPPFRSVVLGRDARLTVLLCLHALAAFALALLVPSLLLALAPIALGVPHVASDVRHLVLRRALPRWWLHAVWVFAASLLALRILEEGGWLPQAPLLLEHGLGSTWLLLGAVGGAMATGWRWPARVALAGAAAVAILSLAEPRLFRLVFVHAHNLMAIAIWVLLFRRGVRRAWIPVAVVLVGAALLSSGLLLPTTLRHGALSVAGLHLFVAADWLAPGLPDRQALGLTMAFAFLQSVHYAIWLVAIPRDDVSAKGGFTFRKAWRELARDLSPAGVGAVAALALLVLGGALFALLETRRLFLSLATFHGWMELALLAFLAPGAAPGLAKRA
jgi:hypothetical protein